MNTNQITIDTQEKERATWKWIRQIFFRIDLSFAELAKLHGVKKENFAKVKHFPYPKYERIIAESVGMEPWDLWPDRYDAAHNPNRVSSRYQGHKLFTDNTSIEFKINEKDRRRNCHEKKA